MTDPVGRLRRVLQDIGRRNPDDLYAGRPKVGVAALVALRPVSHAVRRAIHLNAETRVRAVEIQDVRPNRMLPPEGWLPGLPLAQPHPEQLLRQAQSRPERPSAVMRF